MTDRMSEAEARAEYGDLVRRADYVNDPELRKALCLARDALYTTIQLYNDQRRQS